MQLSAFRWRRRPEGLSRSSPRCAGLCSVYRSRLPGLDLDVAAGFILLERPRVSNDVEELLHNFLDIFARRARHGYGFLLHTAFEIGEFPREFLFRNRVDLV